MSEPLQVKPGGYYYRVVEPTPGERRRPRRWPTRLPPKRVGITRLLPATAKHPHVADLANDGLRSIPPDMREETLWELAQRIDIVGAK